MSVFGVTIIHQIVLPANSPLPAIPVSGQTQKFPKIIFLYIPVVNQISCIYIYPSFKDFNLYSYFGFFPPKKHIKHQQKHTFGYGSIPIDTIFSGMNIHKSQLWLGVHQGYQGFDPSPWQTCPSWFHARSLVVLRQGRLHRCLEALALLGPILRVGRRPAGGGREMLARTKQKTEEKHARWCPIVS